MNTALSQLKARLLKSNLAQQTVLYGLVNAVATAAALLTAISHFTFELWATE